MNASGTAEIEMPKYKSHKTVWALQIEHVVDAGTDTTTDENPIVDLHFKDTRFAPRVGMILRGQPIPKNGWYMVQYEDGYISFSPPGQFEKGNTLEEAPRLAVPPDLRSFLNTEIENWFSYHAPTPEQLLQYSNIRSAGKYLADAINRNVPAGPDKTAAMRKVREAVMTANAGIACHEDIDTKLQNAFERVDMVARNAKLAPAEQSVFDTVKQNTTGTSPA